MELSEYMSRLQSQDYRSAEDYDCTSTPQRSGMSIKLMILMGRKLNVKRK